MRVELVHGSYHEVDSNAMTFEIAGAEGLREAARKAKPVILEPIMSMEVVTPDLTAESIFAALQDVSSEELSRLNVMLLGDAREETLEEEEAEWRRIAAHSAARFDEEESA